MYAHFMYVYIFTLLVLYLLVYMLVLLVFVSAVSRSGARGCLTIGALPARRYSPAESQPRIINPEVINYGLGGTSYGWYGGYVTVPGEQFDCADIAPDFKARSFCLRGEAKLVDGGPRLSIEPMLDGYHKYLQWAPTRMHRGSGDLTGRAADGPRKVVEWTSAFVLPVSQLNRAGSGS